MIRAVIGANFGDEGKGKVTDYYAHGDSIVVRYNAGSQSSHTVITPDGRRHAFSHFGAGSFKGAPTYLSKYFIANPIVYIREKLTLENLDCPLLVYIDPESIITTPFDMLINQILESRRGDNRHGSCGLGINETILRNETSYKFNVKDIVEMGSDMFSQLLERIRDEYLPQRVLPYDLVGKYWDLINHPNLIPHFVSDTMTMLADMEIRTANEILKNKEHIIFEGGQGLLLDKDNISYFPYLTPTNTGLKNVIQLCEEVGVTELEATYVTRCYCTRHGAGYLPHEVPCLPELNIVDETNIPNKFQGTLRFGFLDVDLLADNIRHDLTLAKDIKVNPSIVVTCLDQCIEDQITYFYSGKLQKTNKEGLIKAISDATNVVLTVLVKKPV
jgi:adenylosuccinate synthase